MQINLNLFVLAAFVAGSVARPAPVTHEETPAASGGVCKEVDENIWKNKTWAACKKVPGATGWKRSHEGKCLDFEPTNDPKMPFPGYCYLNRQSPHWSVRPGNIPSGAAGKAAPEKS
ncbi:hypothetical protein H0H87_000241 [Tephrocybe sp. NHM501043]|nr:hypothetical protein H0H87_000241 [Tephrocybe sp. NHM501043]